MPKGIIGAGQSAKREKYWSELKQEEKLERMRGIVKMLSSEIERFQRLIWKIEKHKHNKEGLPIIEETLLSSESQGFGVKTEKSNDVYF